MVSCIVLYSSDGIIGVIAKVIIRKLEMQTKSCERRGPGMLEGCLHCVVSLCD